MNIIKKLFKTGNTESDIIEMKNGINLPLNAPDQNLFSDNGTPEKYVTEKSGGSILNDYIEKDFYTLGYNDGYDYPSANILDAGISKVKSDFIFIIEKKIDEINKEIIKMREHIVNVSDISGKLSEHCKNIVEELRKLILKLIEEKELCAKDEGIIQKALNDYKLGFAKGLHVYTQEKTIGISTGMFN